jgi:acylphosphatase
MNVRAHVFYTGIVQGVGFRYTTQRFADDLGLTGWVKNLSDGRVEMIVVGPKAEILALLERLENHFSGSIRGKDVSYQDPLEQFKDFSVTT